MMSRRSDETWLCGGPARPSGRGAPLRRGLTLVEILVAVGLVLLIFALVAMTTKLVQATARRTRAAAQVQTLAAAIEAYSQAWPTWRDCGNSPVADRAWPHWSPYMLFPLQNCLTNPQYTYAAPSAQILCGLTSVNQRDMSDDDSIDPVGQPTGRDDVGQSSACLAYSLSVPAAGKKLLDNPDTLFKVVNDRAYPRIAAAAPFEVIRLPLDPWGVPLRYMWVVRDPDPTNPSGWRAITFADANDPARPTNPNADPFYAAAQGFVLESAGEDGRFGNIWKRNPTPQEIEDAKDNATVRP